MDLRIVRVPFLSNRIFSSPTQSHSFPLPPKKTELPVLDTRFSKQVRNIIAQRSKERGGRLVKLLIARQNFDAAEIEFADMLMEDHNNAALAYPDCASQALNTSYTDVYCHASSVSTDLSLVHKQITTAVSRYRVITRTSLPNSLIAALATSWFSTIIRSHYTCPVVITFHTGFSVDFGTLLIGTLGSPFPPPC